jgi:predicted Zn-dependent protease with MMP-like domain
MSVSRKQFEQWVREAIDSLPEKFLRRMHNVAFFVEDYPSKEQLKKVRLGRNSVLFGLYEGYHQSSRRDLGPVLPDRITIFRKPILGYYSTEKEIKNQVIKTVKHEIAHHFGSDEKGAHRAGR